MKALNFDMKSGGEKRAMQLCELDVMRLEAYESSRIYKEKTKFWYDKHLNRKNFEVDDLVILYNTQLKLFPGKLKSRWSGPFTVSQVFENGAVKV